VEFVLSKNERDVGARASDSFVRTYMDETSNADPRCVSRAAACGAKRSFIRKRDLVVDNE
jgi:hypothetical protein